MITASSASPIVGSVGSLTFAHSQVVPSNLVSKYSSQKGASFIPDPGTCSRGASGALGHGRNARLNDVRWQARHFFDGALLARLCARSGSTQHHQADDGGE